jgi:hypothetical protein
MLGLFGGGKARVMLTLDRSVATDAERSSPYFLGETVHASVTVASEKEVKIREGRIALVCQEEYQFKHREASSGSRGRSTTSIATSWAKSEREAARQVFLGETSIPAGAQQTFKFDLPIPVDAPPTARGEIVRVKWVVKATLDRPMTGDIEERIDLPVLAGASGTFVQPLQSSVSSEPDEAELGFSLPGRQWVIGETITGQLQVGPKKEFDVTDIRVELVRRERVPRELGNQFEATTPVKISGGRRLTPGQTVALPFSIAIPPSVPASLRTPNAAVGWLLRGVLARRLRKDTVAEEEIALYSGRQS